MISDFLAFLAGGGLVLLLMRARVLGLQAGITALRQEQAALRHDLRGILSPAMLVADRLVGHETAYVNRAGEVMIKTVERAAERLSQPLDTKLHT